MSLSDQEAPTLQPTSSGEIPQGRSHISFGDYQLLQELARGGMGSVYKARQISVNRIVALKLMLSGEMASLKEIARFQQEAEAVAKIEHPGIVPIYDAGEFEGKRFIAMAFLPGGDLDDKVRDHGPLPNLEAAQLVHDIAEAMECAHQHNIIHRDLKPGNILLTEDGQPRVSDFGIAKPIDNDSHLTVTGEVIGTPGYISPEQAIPEPELIGPKSDVYAIGAILYFTLTGRPPYCAPSAAAALYQVIETQVIPPILLNPDISEDLNTICLKCLEKDPDKRYESAQALAEDLQRYCDGQPILARPISKIEKAWRWCKRNPVIASLLGTIVVTLVAGSIISTLFAIRATDAEKLAEKKASSELKHRILADQRATQEQLAKEKAEQSEKKALEAKAKEVEARELAEEERERSAKQLYLYQTLLADQYWKHQDSAGAWRALNSTHWQYRGWEHDYLHTKFTSEVVDLLVPAKSRLFSAALTPDGKRLFTASEGHGLNMYDGVTGKLLQKPDLRRTTTLCLAMDPQGRFAVSGHSNASIKMWDARTGKIMATLKGHRFVVTSVGISPDGKLIASGSRGGIIKIWDTQSKKELVSVKETIEPNRPKDLNISSLTFTPDGKRLISGTGQGKLRLRETKTGRFIQYISQSSGATDHVEFSPSGDKFLGVGFARDVKIWKYTATDQQVKIELLKSLDQPIKRLNGAAFSPDGKTVAAGGFGRNIWLWDVESGELLRVLKGHKGGISGLTFYPDSSRLVSTGYLGELKIWTLKQSQQAFTIPNANIHGLEYTDNETLFVWMVRGSTIVVGNVTNPKTMKALKGHTEIPNEVACHRKSQLVASSSPRDQTLRLWNVKTGKQLFLLDKGTFTALAFSSDGRSLATGTRERSVKLWDTSTGKVTLTIPNAIHTRIRELAFSPDGKYIVIGDINGSISVRDCQTGKEFRRLTDHGKVVETIRFNSDGSLMALGMGEGTIKIWKWQTDEKPLIRSSHYSRVSQIAWTPDESRLVSTGWDGTLKVWDPISGQELLTLQGIPEYPMGLTFNANGSRLALVGFRGQGIIWDASRSQKIKRLMGSQHRITHTGFDPTGNYILAINAAGEKLVWNATTGQPSSAKESFDPMPTRKMSPDGKVRLEIHDKEVHWMPKEYSHEQYIEQRLSQFSK